MAFAIGQRCVAFEQFAQIMGVRVDGQNVDIQRQAEVVRHEKILVTGGNVQGSVVFELEQDREMSRRLVREVETYGGLNHLGLTRWLQVRVENKVVAGFETPGEAIGLGVRRTAGFPEEEMPRWIEDAGLDVEVHAGKACAWSFFHFSSRIEAVDEQVRVMHKPFVARANFNGANVPGGGDIWGEDEIPEDIGPSGG